MQIIIVIELSSYYYIIKQAIIRVQEVERLPVLSFIYKQINNKQIKITNIKTKEIITDFKETPSNYLVKCDSAKYATHIDEAGNYYCMYGNYAAFDGTELIILNNK